MYLHGLPAAPYADLRHQCPSKSVIFASLRTILSAFAGPATGLHAALSAQNGCPDTPFWSIGPIFRRSRARRAGNASLLVEPPQDCARESLRRSPLERAGRARLRCGLNRDVSRETRPTHLAAGLHSNDSDTIFRTDAGGWVSTSSTSGACASRRATSGRWSRQARPTGHGSREGRPAEGGSREVRLAERGSRPARAGSRRDPPAEGLPVRLLLDVSELVYTAAI